MNQTELEQRIKEATTTELVAALVADVRAWKDAQLNELTQQLNAVPAQIAEAVAAISAERDQLRATIDSFLAADEKQRQDMLAAAAKSEKQKRIEAVTAEIAEDKAELARDEDTLRKLQE